MRDISVRAPYGENLWRALARRAGRLQGIHFTTLDSRHMPKVLELAAVAPGLDFTLDYCVLGLGPLLLDAQLPPWAQLQVRGRLLLPTAWRCAAHALSVSECA